MIVVPIIFGVVLCLMWCLFIVNLLVDVYKTLKTMKKKNTKNTIMIQKFRKKPVVVEAIQFVGTMESAGEILEFVGLQGEIVNSKESDHLFNFIIHTLEGDMIAEVGDYIIKGVNGEFYPCKPDIFEKTYEKAD